MAPSSGSLDTLKLIDDFPLYTMHYQGEYSLSTDIPIAISRYRQSITLAEQRDSPSHHWGCSLFAALGDPDNIIYGRNFDWHPSPALLLFFKPARGYASVSMVDIAYLGFEGERAKKILELPIKEQQALLDSPSLPFDGMNEKGLVVGMASVPSGNMPDDPMKPSIDSLFVMREILDHASIVEEAVEILKKYDIDMGSVPLHYLIADITGKAVLVEFYQGEMIIDYNEEPWLVATNFIVASAGDSPQGQCQRYDLIYNTLDGNRGIIILNQAMNILKMTSSSDPTYGTQWSVVYDSTSGDISVVLGRNYHELFTFNIKDEYNADSND
ncbi:MAG: linear amide C-N hydrolase [Anaerolineales bacterium]|nr:linear amide C-N hydrolase [Anaerolineales bacterium]